MADTPLKFTDIPNKGEDWIYLPDFDKPRGLTASEKSKINEAKKQADLLPVVDYSIPESQTGIDQAIVPQFRLPENENLDYISKPVMQYSKQSEQVNPPQTGTTQAQPQFKLPPEGYESPVTRYQQLLEKRPGFENYVINKVIGFNPYEFDPEEELSKTDAKLPSLFRHVFGGRIAWADRNKLNKKEREYWADIVKQFRADNEKALISKKANAIEKYKYMMGRYDDMVKTEEAKAKKIEERLKEMRQQKVWIYNPKDKVKIQVNPYQAAEAVKSGKWKYGEKYGTDLTPKEMSWTSASKSLSARFGKQDAQGNIIITKDLQNAHRLAQKKLVELKKENYSPMDAVNKAEDFARSVEEKYWEYKKKAADLPRWGNEREKYLKQLDAQFKNKYGYIPKINRTR